MKKIFSMAAMAALMLGMTSCLNDEADSITTISVDMYNFVVNNDDSTEEPTLTTAECGYEFNFSRFTANSIVKLGTPTVAAAFQTQPLEMKVGKQSYEFTTPMISSMGQVIKGFKGMYDPNPGVLTMSYSVDDQYQVYSTSSFAYNFARMNVFESTDADAKIKFSTSNVAFMFVPNLEKKTMTLRIVGLKRSQGDISVAVRYDDIPYTLLHAGVIVGKAVDTLTALESEATTATKLPGYDITDLSVDADVVKNTCTVVFNMDGQRYELYGGIFTLLN